MAAYLVLIRRVAHHGQSALLAGNHFFESAPRALGPLLAERQRRFDKRGVEWRRFGRSHRPEDARSFPDMYLIMLGV